MGKPILRRQFGLLIWPSSDLEEDNTSSKPPWHECLAHLQQIAGKNGVRLLDATSLSQAASADLIVLLAGSPSAEELRSACRSLKDSGNDVLIVADAIADRWQLTPVLAELGEQSVQIVVTGGLERLIASEHLMVYRFSKADSTATVAAIADINDADPLILTIVRDREPFKGMESLPGGFLNVHLETLPECASRELMEECFYDKGANGRAFTYRVKSDSMVLIDVRSGPDRDERGHVIDHGYAWFINPDEQGLVMSALAAGDDAREGSTRFIRASELLARQIAFDHRELVIAALRRLKSTAPH